MIRRGGLIFEALLALALFVVAAGFTLGVVRNVTNATERTVLEQEALDLARSRLAELDAGLTNIANLRDESRGVDLDGEDALAPSRWRLDVDTERAPWPGLTLVTITVEEDTNFDAAARGRTAVSVTLRQLVALRDDGDSAVAP